MQDDVRVQGFRSGLEQRAQSDSGISDWRLEKKTRFSVQRMYQGDTDSGLRIHQSRRVEEESYRLVLYYRHGDPEKIGIGMLDLDPFQGVDVQIDRAIEIAQANGNPTWTPCSPPEHPYPKVQTADPAILEDAEAVADALQAQAMEAVSSLQGVNVNSAELFVNKRFDEFVTGTGISHGQWRSDLYFETAMEKLPLPNEQEVHRSTSAISISDFRLADFLTRSAEEARSLGQTQEPETSNEAAVILPAEYISHLLDTLRGQLNAHAEYMKMPFLAPGQAVWAADGESKGDRLTMVLDPTRDTMAESCSATGEGMIPRKATVIEDGIVTAQLCNNRYGQYLKREPNFISGNMIVPAGTVSMQEMRKTAGVIEILSFLSFLVNEHSLTWSSEIKLARLYQADGSFVLLKGGVMSGSLRDNLLDFQFSSECETFNLPGNMLHGSIGYMGPKAMLIRSGLAIAGQ